MSDEIKEKIDFIKQILNRNELIKCSQYFNDLLDYITNLQQINDNLTTSLNKKIEEGINLQQENEYLKKNNPEQNIEHFRIIKENKRKINNLREQNKTLQESNQNMQEEMARVWEENEKLKKNKLTPDELANLLNQELIKQRDDYKSRCEKAIEYINKKDEWVKNIIKNRRFIKHITKWK